MHTKKANTNWHVITGGPSTGKTTVINMLEKRGIFPGLPFPIMLGLGFGLIVGFLF